jgi:uncharacterized membrane protein YphA (DoxX/SURF4 family)
VNIVVWVVQVLLAIAFAFSGFMKMTQPEAKLIERMPYVEDFPGIRIKLIGAVEVLGALGLVLPAWTGIAPILTPIAAAGFCVHMLLAAVVHIRRKEFNALPINAVLFVLALFVAIMRFGPYSY